jgi:hypothetical protein
VLPWVDHREQRAHGPLLLSNLATRVRRRSEVIARAGNPTVSRFASHLCSLSMREPNIGHLRRLRQSVWTMSECARGLRPHGYRNVTAER